MLKSNLLNSGSFFIKICEFKVISVNFIHSFRIFEHKAWEIEIENSCKRNSWEIKVPSVREKALCF